MHTSMPCIQVHDLYIEACKTCNTNGKTYHAHKSMQRTFVCTSREQNTQEARADQQRTCSFNHPPNRTEPGAKSSQQAQETGNTAEPGPPRPEWQYAETDFPAMPGVTHAPVETRDTGPAGVDGHPGISLVVNEEELCGICYEGRANASLMPCGHSFCSVCIARLKKRAVCTAAEGVQCPNCRAPVQQFVLPEDGEASPSIPVWGTPKSKSTGGVTPGTELSSGSLTWGSPSGKDAASPKEREDAYMFAGGGTPAAAAAAAAAAESSPCGGYNDSKIVLKVRLTDRDISIALRYVCVCVCVHV